MSTTKRDRQTTVMLETDVFVAGKVRAVRLGISLSEYINRLMRWDLLVPLHGSIAEEEWEIEGGDADV